MPITVIGLDRVVAGLQGAETALAQVGGMSATIAPHVPYAGFVSNGTRAHEIYPVFAQALWWPGAAHPVAYVHHPGTKANPYLDDALTTELPVLEKELHDGVVMALTTGDVSEIRAGFHRGVEAVHAEVVRRAPRKSGNLADSITVEYSK